MAVIRCSSRSAASEIPASAAPANSVLPASSTATAAWAAAAVSSFSGSLENLVSLASRGAAFSSVCRSARISSVTTVSMSPSGSDDPSTRVTSGSRKTRTTWQIASVSRMCPRNWLPRPCPCEAPFTSPAISVNRTDAGTIRAELYSFASAASRGSGTPTTPTFGSIVANG